MVRAIEWRRGVAALSELSLRECAQFRLAEPFFSTYIEILCKRCLASTEVVGPTCFAAFAQACDRATAIRQRVVTCRGAACHSY